MSGSSVKIASTKVAATPKKGAAASSAKKEPKKTTNPIRPGAKKAGRPKAPRDSNGNIIKKGSYTYINRKPAPPKIRKQIPEGELLRAIALMGSLKNGELDLNQAIKGGSKENLSAETTAHRLESLERLHSWMEEIKNAPAQRFVTLQKKVSTLREEQRQILAQESETVRLQSLQSEIQSMEKELNHLNSDL